MKVILLHLSDIHIREQETPILERARQIATTLFSILPDASALFVVITGDIAFSGTQNEYVQAAGFLNRLLDVVKHEFDKPVHVVMVPGNHDGKFKDAGNARGAIVEKVREKGVAFIDDAVIQQCTLPQAHYFEFEKLLASEGLDSGTPLWKEYRFDIGGKTIRFSSINASWMSQVPEEPGKLVFPVKRFAANHNCDAALSIVLLHHPLNWYAQETYHPLRDLCRTHFQFVMTGHEHVNGASSTTDSENNQIVNLEAGALSPDDGTESSFSIITVDLEKERFAKENFIWDKTDLMYLPESGQAVWDAFSPLPESRPNSFQISEEMKSRLETLGAAFSHPNTDALKLSDVFVYPELLELDPEDETQETINADIFPKQLNKLGKVLIYGDDQFGKTSLLLHLFQQYHDTGFVPILLDGQELGGATEEQFARIVNRHVDKQYGEDFVNKFSQTDRINKIALVDNIDRAGSRGDVLSRVVNYLSAHFGSLMLTAGDRFDVTMLSSKEASQAMTPFKTYRMLGFGFKLRNQLIRRWYQVGADIDASVLQDKVHSSEQLINSILGKGLVPMTAFNVLILLQAIEVNQRGALANAGLAQYYEFLIRQNLFDAKVRSDELDEFLSYLSYLAWEMRALNSKSMQESELAEFNSRFSRDVHKTSLVQRLVTLENAKILVRKGDGFVFTYSYLRYFFVARYLADNLEEDDKLKELVVHICRHLYLKENANIVLFLTHHSNSRWIVQEIAAVLSDLLSDVLPLNLESDAALLNSWVGEKARVVIDTTDVVENQKQMREKDDSVSAYKEPDHATELASIKELDKFSQLNLLFKTSEILGQILKGRYGSMKNEVKAELIEELFEAPLRGVNFFLSLVNDSPDALLGEISARIQSKVKTATKEQADQVAKRFIFSVIGAVADSFLSRQGEIIGSPKLLDSIERVAKEKNELTYELVSISAQLSYPNHVPTEQIKKLAVQFDKNYFGYKILQGLVARHMYMFSLPAPERHALASAVGIDVHGQRGIEMKSQAAKKLPGKQSALVHSKSLIARLHESFLANNQTIRETMARYAKKESKDDGKEQ